LGCRRAHLDTGSDLHVRRYNSRRPARLVWQIVLATVAFPVWVFATGGHPVVSIAWYAQHEFIGSLVLMFVTVIFGLKEP